MTSNREQSLNFGENTSYIIKDLNETQLSHITKESAEKDYKELESLINKAVREDKGNISILSTSKIVDKSNSMLSNDEIWNEDRSPDDSKNFIKNFKDISVQKKMSIFQREKKNKMMSKKPKHLSIITPFQKKVEKENEKKDEDYNEEIEESIDSQKNQQVNQMGNLETKINDLSELSMNNQDQAHTPDDFYQYRAAYPYANFSFTPQRGGLNLNLLANGSSENYFYQGTGMGNYPIFPTIPKNYEGQDEKSNEENIFSGEKGSEKEEVNLINKENFNNQTANENNQPKKLNKNKHSTRHSTESNDSIAELNSYNNINNRKFFTPTHTNLSRQYNISQVQRELDFGGGNPLTANMNKFNPNPTTIKQNRPTNVLSGSSNLVSPTTTAPLFSPTLNPNVNGMKSLSFCANTVNNLKSPSTVRYNVMDVKPRCILNPVMPGNLFNDSKFPKEESYDYKINLENIIIGKDKRTTLMLRNIPNKYTLQNLVDEINPSFWGKYDYINLPIDYERKLNLGYAFINFVDPLHIVNFYETYYLKKWSRYRSDKKIDLNYAEKQGKKDITCKDENTYFAAEDKKINFKKLNPKLELPMKYFDFFKKIYPISVCIVDNKNSIGADKTFHIKSLGKK